MLPLKVAGIGVYLPEHRETKEDFIRRGIPEETIEKLGVYERRIVAKGQTAADLELEAAKIAIRNSGMAPTDIDLILSATVLPEMIAVPNSNLLQYRLGASKAAAFDIVQGCGSGIPGLILAANFISLGQYQRILLTVSTHWSVIADTVHPSADFPLGDGAAAVVLTESGCDYGLISFDLKTNGRFYYNCGIGIGHDRQNRYYEQHDERLLFYLDKSGVDGSQSDFRDFVITALPATFKTALRKANLTSFDVDCVALHGNVKPLAQAWIREMAVPAERFPLTYDRYGNLSAVTIFANLQEGLNTGMIQRGNIVALAAQGAGFTSGSVIMRWD